MSLQFAVGWMVDRWNVNLIMALGFLVWSLSTAATGLATGFGMMLVMRIMLGVGESVMFPASSKICALHLPEHCRGVANAMLIAAIRWGSAVGTFGGGMIMARFGWRHTFIGFGLVGLLWLPAWQLWKPKPVDAGSEDGAGNAGLRRHPSPAIVLGRGYGALLRELPSLFSDQLAALLPGPRAASFHGQDGGHGRNPLRH